jgi:hypothetical protein
MFANQDLQSGQNRETERAKVPVECQAGHVTKPLPHDHERERITVGEASSRGQTSKDLQSGSVVSQVGNNHFDSRHDIPGEQQSRTRPVTARVFLEGV